MTIIPTVRCQSLKDAVKVNTHVLDFVRGEKIADLSDPGHCILKREGCELHLSSHSGDGEYGQAIVVLTKDTDGLFRKFVKRGLDISGQPNSPVAAP